LVNSFYIQRINKVIDYIEDHLAEKFTLEKLATIAMFSKYHFHRIFKHIAGDTLNNYIKRLRMEKAGKMLAVNNKETVLNIATALGYNNNANFSRDFNDYYGCSPSEFRHNKMKPMKREIYQGNNLTLGFSGIEHLTDFHVTYIRVATGYHPAVISKSFKKLYNHAMEFDLWTPSSRFIGIGYDDPDYTPLDKCRYDACMTINKTDFINTGLNTKNIKGGKYASFEFSGKKESFFNAWDIVFNDWLLVSDYIPDDKPHLEVYLPVEQQAKEIFHAKLYLPVKLLNK
jgi:AraC family transcriptional regulator